MKLSILKYVLVAAGLFLIFLIEQSFLLHLRTAYLAGAGIFLFVFLLNFFYPKHGGYFTAILGGLLLDMSSPYNFGVFVLTLAFLALIMQKSERFFHRFNIFAFISLLIFAILFYKFLPLLLNYLLAFWQS